jgi:hypothetical protein
MEEEISNKLDLSKIKEDMKHYYLVSKIYEICDMFEEKEITYNIITINHKMLDYIREVNFIFSSDVGIVEDIKEKRKIGQLLHLQTFLDPNQTENEIIFSNDNSESFILEVTI